MMRLAPVISNNIIIGYAFARFSEPSANHMHTTHGSHIGLYTFIIIFSLPSFSHLLELPNYSNHELEGLCGLSYNHTDYARACPKLMWYPCTWRDATSQQWQVTLLRHSLLLEFAVCLQSTCHACLYITQRPQFHCFPHIKLYQKWWNGALINDKFNGHKLN